MKSIPLLLSVFVLAGCCTAAEPVYTPAPEPVAAAPVARDFIVYFAFDKSDLTGAASDIVSEIASYANGMDGASVSLRGHTDTSGSNSYNMGLSERRASSVGNALAAAGVGGSSSSWAGEGETAVDTGDGVREPLNRRVTVHVSN